MGTGGRWGSRALTSSKPTFLASSEPRRSIHLDPPPRNGHQASINSWFGSPERVSERPKANAFRVGLSSVMGRWVKINTWKETDVFVICSASVVPLISSNYDLLLPSHTACLGRTRVIQGLTFSDHLDVDILPVNVLVEPQGTNNATKI